MEFYAILDANEIDGQGKDVIIDAEEGDVAWTKVVAHPAQEVPAGEYVFAVSMQSTLSSTNNSALWRVAGSVVLDEEELHVDRARPLIRHTYFFNLSWEGGPFNIDIEMARDGTSFTALSDYAEFVLSRRT